MGNSTTRIGLTVGVKYFASAGNRTRAARVAGEHSTTEPPMLARSVCDFNWAKWASGSSDLKCDSLP